MTVNKITCRAGISHEGRKMILQINAERAIRAVGEVTEDRVMKA